MFILGPCIGHSFAILSRSSSSFLSISSTAAHHNHVNAHNTFYALYSIQSSSEISWTLVHKWGKMGPEFSPDLLKFSILLCCQALHTENRAPPNFAKREEVNGADASWMKWRRIENVNETIDIRSLVFRGPNNQLKLAMASRRAAFSGNTSSVATFSSTMR